MSKIGKKNINIPQGITVEVDSDRVRVKGSKGFLELGLTNNVKVEVDNDLVKVRKLRDTKQAAAQWGLYRSLIANMIKGVSEDFERRLELHGVGYRASGGGKQVTLNLGYSHPVSFSAPDGVELVVEDQTKVIVKGMDKYLVGQTAADIKKLRKPEPYKGKGIRYEGEVVRRKAGKAGVK